MIAVPNRNVPVQYDINQVEKQQLAATNAVYAAIKVVADQKDHVEKAREYQAKTTLALQFATTQENSAEFKVKEAAANKVFAEATAAKAQEVLEAANKIVQLATTNVNNAIRVVAASKEDLEHAQQRFDAATKKLENANNLFINAQT